MKTLYSRTSTGAIQTWTIEVVENKYRIHSGQLDGKIVTSEWTICNGKNINKSNQTSPAEQALIEAQSKWKKKLDSGYHENINEIDIVKFIEPMLAKKYGEHDFQFPVISQPKLDGIRCVISSSGMFTRNGKLIVSVPHIFDSLISSNFFKQYPNYHLDGELYCDKYANDFNKICSLVKKTKPSIQDLKDSKNAIEFWVFDVIKPGTFIDRWNFIDNIDFPNFIVKTPTTICHTQSSLDDFYHNYMSDGFEGQIIRINTEYENKRSKYLLKRKEFIDEEFEILGYEEGVGNRSGTLGATLHKNKNGKSFKSNIKGSRNYVASLWKDRKNLLGKMATIKFFDYTPDKIPRFPFVISIRDYE